MATHRSGVGGKIVTYRRKERLAAKPYDRPPPPLPPEIPNWFFGVIVPSARAIASGAGRILTSLFNDSESSDEEEEYASDCYLEEDDANNDTHLGGDVLSEKKVASTEILHGTENKRTIEKLIMQETFSREECDRLTRALKSHVVESVEAGEKGLLSGSPGNADGPEYDKVIREAKKWFDVKKTGSNSVKEFPHGTDNLTTAGVEHVDGGSPVDVARSYMEHRAPLTSPKRHDLITPLAVTRLFREETSHSVDRYSRTSSKKRSSLASDSWSFQTERRRARSKAIDDLLCTRSSKIDPLSLAVAPVLESLGAGKTQLARGRRTAEPESSKIFKPTYSLVDAGMSSDPTLAALKSRQDGSSQDSDAVHANIENAAPKPLQPSSPKHDEDHHSGLLDTMNGPPVTSEAVRNATTNGFSSSKARAYSTLQGTCSTPAGVTLGQNNQQHDTEIRYTDSINENNPLNTETNSALLGDSPVEVPIVTETDSITSGSQNIASLQHEGMLLDAPQPSALEPVKEKRKGSGRNTQRNRGRGK